MKLKRWLIVFGCLLLLVWTNPFAGKVRGETPAQSKKQSGLQVLRAGTEAPTPPQDIVIFNTEVFADLAEKKPKTMESILQFFRELPEQVNLYAFRGFKLRDKSRFEPKFVPLALASADSFTKSMNLGFSRHNPRSSQLEKILESWPGNEVRPGIMLFIRDDFNRSQPEISPETLRKLRKNRVVMHRLLTKRPEAKAQSYQTRFNLLSGGFTTYPGHGLAANSLTTLAENWSQKTNAQPQSKHTESISDVRPGELQQCLRALLPLRAYNPRVKAKDGSQPHLEPQGFAWTGQIPLVVRSTQPAEALTIRTGERTLLSHPNAQNSESDRQALFKELKYLSLKRRQLIYELAADQKRWLDWLSFAQPAGNNDRQWEFTPKNMVELLTGRMAIEETLQINNWETFLDQKQPRKQPISTLQPPELDHLNYEQMVAKLPDKKPLPLTGWAPEDMAALTFEGIDTALQAGELVNFWSSDLFRMYLDETGDQLVKKRFLDRLGVKMNENMKPFYRLAVQEVGFLFNEPSVLNSQDVALLMRVKNRRLVKTRLDQVRASLRERYPAATKTELQLTVNGEAHEVVAFRTPDRAISSYVWFHEDAGVIATSRQTLAKIIRVISGPAPSLAERSDVEYLSRALDEASGYMVMSDSFVSKIIQPAWRLKFDRRKRCLTRLKRLEARTSFREKFFGEADTAPIEGLCSPEQSVRYKNGHWTSPVYGHAGFARPIEEISIERVTEREAVRYQNFVDEYHELWQRAIDPIGLGVDLSADQTVSFETLILPLVNQSIYGQLSQIVEGTRAEKMDSWQSLPTATAAGAIFINPLAQYEQGKIDPGYPHEKTLKALKKRTRRDLKWPEDKPLFDWLGDEWGVVTFDFGPEKLLQWRKAKRWSRRKEILSSLPVGYYQEVKDKAKAEFFLKKLKQFHESKRRPGRRNRKRTRRNKHDTYTVFSILRIPLYVNVKEDKLLASFNPTFLDSEDQQTLSESSNLTEIIDQYHQASQGQFFTQLDRTASLRKFLNPLLFTAEKAACKTLRSQQPTEKTGPYGGEWFEGPGGQTFCTKHSSYSSRSHWERVEESGLPEIADKFPLKRKLGNLNETVFSFEVSPLEYSVKISANNPLLED